MSFFKRKLAPARSNIDRFILIAKHLQGDQCPETDSGDNAIANILREKVSGITHIHDGCDPQKLIPRLKNGERLAFVPYPENEFDATAIKVVTMRGKYIGWFPANGTRHAEIFRRLMDGREIWVNVYDHGQYKNGPWWCEIYVVYYATDYDPGLSKK